MGQIDQILLSTSGYVSPEDGEKLIVMRCKYDEGVPQVLIFSADIASRIAAAIMSAATNINKGTFVDYAVVIDGRNEGAVGFRVCDESGKTIDASGSSYKSVIETMNTTFDAIDALSVAPSGLKIATNGSAGA